MSAEPQRPADVPRRATGEIPLSWAMPAEVVTAAVPPRKSPVSLVTIAGALLAFAIAGFFATRLLSPDPVVVERTPDVVTPVPPGPTPPPPTAVAVVPVTPPDVKTVAVAEAPVVSGADRARAKQLVGKARRLAKDGDVDAAHDLAEKAVVADPECADCWKTVALLRKKTGDRAGSTLAKARADALSADEERVDP